MLKIMICNDSHFHLFSLLICGSQFLSFKLTVRTGQQSQIGVMGQDLIDDDFSQSGVNEDVPLRKTNHEEVKRYKCNQCNYASSHAGHLRTHFKTHSGEKPNKCNQCDFASSRAGHLRRHLKTHSGEKSKH